jgi:hypothetical protein
MCGLRASDFVECIDNHPVHKQSKTMPELGRLYTVESVRSIGNGFSVRLNELTPECFRGGRCSCGNCGWDAGRFRKVYRPDGAALHALLDTTVGTLVSIGTI